MLLEHFGLHEEAKKYMTELKLQLDTGGNY
jgi:hypothetical protein